MGQALNSKQREAVKQKSVNSVTKIMTIRDRFESQIYIWFLDKTSEPINLEIALHIVTFSDTLFKYSEF